jgi:polar amino acid transport system substrate-binding protein
MNSTIKRLMSVATLTLAFALPGHAETYNAGSTPTGVPFTFLNTQTGEVQGVMVDLVQEIAKDQGDTVNVQGMGFSTLIPSLSTGKLDIIAAALGITEKRKEVVDYTQPVYSYGEAVFVSADDTKDYNSLDDLKGEVIGVQSGTVYVDPMKETGLFSDIKIYDSLANIMRDVKLGRIKAGVGDFPIVAYQINHGGQDGVRIIDGYEPMVNVQIAMAVRKGNEALLEKLDTSITKLKENGVYDDILAKWGLK